MGNKKLLFIKNEFKKVLKTLDTIDLITIFIPSMLLTLISLLFIKTITGLVTIFVVSCFLFFIIIFFIKKKYYKK